jgi:hypothetical protein
VMLLLLLMSRESKSRDQQEGTQAGAIRPLQTDASIQHQKAAHNALVAVHSTMMCGLTHRTTSPELGERCKQAMRNISGSVTGV